MPSTRTHVATGSVYLPGCQKPIPNHEAWHVGLGFLELSQYPQLLTIKHQQNSEPVPRKAVRPMLDRQSLQLHGGCLGEGPPELLDLNGFGIVVGNLHTHRLDSNLNSNSIIHCILSLREKDSSAKAERSGAADGMTG